MAAGVAIAIATALGAAFAPYLLVRHPFLLLALNAWPRHQLLVAPQAPIIPFVIVVAVRGLVGCAVSFELGRHYGARGVALIEGHASSSARLVRLVERLFGRFSLVFLLFTPGWLTSALAGVTGISRGRCLTLNMLGVTGWALVHHQIGSWIQPWTAPIMQFLRQHVLLTTVLCVALVAVYQGYSLRKRQLHKQLTALRKRAGDETPQ